MKKVQFLQETELGTGVYGATHLADITEMEFKTNYLGVDLKKVGIFHMLVIQPGGEKY